MQSKISFFNGTIFKKNIKRTWPLWGVIAFCGAMIDIGVTTYVKLDSAGFNGKKDTAEYYYSALTGAGPILTLFYGIIVAGFIWNYLYTNRSVGFFSSIPVTRSALFVTNYVSGMVIMAIPFVVTGLLSIPACFLVGIFNLKAFTLTLVGVLLECFLFFSMATLIAHVTGNCTALVVLYFVFNFIWLLVEVLVTSIASSLLYGVSVNYTGKLTFLSPCVKLYEQVKVLYGRDPITYEKINPVLKGYSTILWYALAALALTVAAALIYKKRRNETATEIISFEVLKPVILGFLSLVLSISGGMLLYYVVTGFDDSEIVNPVVFTITTLVAGAIVYYVCLMFMEKTIRVFKKKNLPEFVLLSVIYVLMITFFGLDLGHAETRLPDTDDILNVSFFSGGSSLAFEGDDVSHIEKVRAIHQTAIDYKEIAESGYIPENYSWNYITIWYVLKDGTTINRNYRIVLDDSEGATENPVFAKAYELMNDREVLRSEIENDGFLINTCNLGYCIEDNYASLNLNNQEAELVIKGMEKDIDEGNLSAENLFFIPYKMADSGEVSICFDLYKLSSGNTFETEEWKSVEVRFGKEMKNTVAALLEAGIFTEDTLPEGLAD